MERWTVRNVKFNCEAFAKALGISNIVARLLVNRDIYKLEDAKSFLNSNIDDFEDYNKLLDID
ncbi:single-stranded-DNA-specific exonuclease RecJ, partial [Clostridium saudiense]|nr:single-stranded-DNA-specific exonuclease RecJ [Clostridium saudiense]